MERNRKEGDRKRKKDRQTDRLSRKISPPSGSCGILLVFSVVRDPESFFCRYHLYIVQVLGIHRVVPDVPTTWAGVRVSSCFLSHILHSGIFVWFANSKPSPPLGLELAPSCLPYSAYVKFLLLWLILWEDPSLIVFSFSFV